MALKWVFGFSFKQFLGLISLQHEDLIQTCPNLEGRHDEKKNKGIEIVNIKEDYPNGFQMPLHYPRYNKEDYEKMEEWKLDMLLKQYGLQVKGTLYEKREFAIGTFLWS